MKKNLFCFCAILLALILLAGACAPVDTSAPENTQIEASPTSEPIMLLTEAPSRVGGTLVQIWYAEPDSLDPHKTYGQTVSNDLYSSLVAFNPEGEIVPYLAHSWEISPDGLTYTFHLKQNIKFHNGDPLTAADVVWTYQDQLNPETAAPTSSFLSAVDTIQALDDYTVQIKLKHVDYYLLSSLANNVYEGILNQRVVEQNRDTYGRNPIGTGPFMFKEWVTGDHITLERNPDFVWGPPFMNDQPANIETIEYRFISEVSTILAGLEAGEIDALQGEDKLSPTDINSLEATGLFEILKPLYAGINPYVTLNVETAPFDDVRVRQALNYAVNKQSLMGVVTPNSGAGVQNGPLSSNMDGYWAGVEEIGYPFDLEKAKQLLQEAGYTYNADGMLEKNGQPLSFELWTFSGFDVFTKSAQVLQMQWKDLGVDVKLIQQDIGVTLDAIFSGNYQASMMSMSGPNSGYLIDMFHSKNLGGLNMTRINDPELDAILDRMANAVNPDDNLQAAREAQEMIVEQAYLVPLFNQPTAEVVSKEVKDAFIIRGYLCFWSAYFEK